MKKAVSMKDVAKAANVSQPAVSYAYGRPDKISAGLREHILTTAKRIGYPGPNALGSSLRSGKVGAVGLMMMDKLSLAFDDPSTVALLKGVGQSGAFENLALTLFPLNHRGDFSGLGGANTDSSLALRGLVDGLIITTLPDNHPIIDQLTERRIPFVIVDSPKVEGVNFIGIDDYAAARQQMRHLLDLGHRKIGILVDRLRPDNHVGPVSHARLEHAVEAVVRERLRGYIDAAADVALGFDDLYIWEAGGLGMTAGQSAAFHILSSTRITGVVATSDVMALACMKTAADLGIDVPGELSVIGFDDIPEALRAGLTTIQQPMVEKGVVAAQFIKKCLESGQNFPNEGLRKIFETRIIMRASTRAV